MSPSMGRPSAGDELEVDGNVHKPKASAFLFLACKSSGWFDMGFPLRDENILALDSLQFNSNISLKIA